MSEPIDLFCYHDLTKRLSSFAADGGAYLRGDREDLVVRDGEPTLAPGEVEHARVAGVLQLVGARSTETSATPTLGLVLEGAGIVIVTSHRFIVMMSKGISQIGHTDGQEVHTFVLPLDLVSSIAMAAKKSLTDRLAGGRDIEVLDLMTVTRLMINPVKRAEIGGREVAVTDEDVMRILVEAAVGHRLSVSPIEDHARLDRVRRGEREREGNELVAWITSSDSADVPPHLVGRLVERPAGADPAPSRPAPVKAPSGYAPPEVEGTPAQPAPTSPQPTPTNPAAAGDPASQPAGWFPDPHGRYEHRYWDGTAWTTRVSSAGVMSADPL